MNKNVVTKNFMDYYFQAKLNLLSQTKIISSNSIELTYKLYKEIEFLFLLYEMPENIYKHSVVVGLVAACIQESYKNKLDDHTIIRGAFLHDIAKIQEIMSDGEINHAWLGNQILCQHNYIKEGEYCLFHTVEAYLNPNISEEARIVNLADRLVNNHMVVTLNQRFEYLRNQYPKFKELFSDSVKEIYEKDIIFFNAHTFIDKIILINKFN